MALLLQNFCMVSSFFAFFLLSSCLSDDQMHELALASPVEDILKYPEVKKYLEQDKHKVFISLTTSPKRSKTLKLVLDTLDTTHIKKIFLVLPERYRNEDKDSYDVPDDVKNFNKLEILRIPDDLGPLSKLVPAVEWIQKEYPDPENIIITIDDDIAYPRGQINGLLKNVILKDAVVSGSGFYTSYFNVRHEDWEESELLSPYCYLGAGVCDVVEGYAGIAYKIKHIASMKHNKLKGTGVLKYLSKLGYPDTKSCFLSDDLVISFALARAKVTRWVISDEFMFRPWPYNIGMGEDALHLGSGAEKSRPSNWTKYESCFGSFLSKEIF